MFTGRAGRLWMAAFWAIIGFLVLMYFLQSY
jgi:hypothetical protein